MDTGSVSGMDDSLRRLASFQEYPLPEPGRRNHASLLTYNSPMKLSKAGFYRHPGALGDEVKCFQCSVSFRGWSGESPMAVHRVLSPDCAFLARHTPALLTARRPGRIRPGDPRNVRRRLQMSTPTSTVDTPSDTGSGVQEQSVLAVYDRYNTPRTPEQLDSENQVIESDERMGSMLFGSHRLLTFPSPTHPRAEVWAGSGFVYQGEGGVVRCVFCGLEMLYDVDEPVKRHQEMSKNCPVIKYLDIGNIPRDLENKIRSQHLGQSCDNSFVSGDPMFKHPQFEEMQDRLETFKYWSEQIRPTADQLCQAGFYFTGYTDKVVCFACGCGLHHWKPEANPWVQHARHAPHCVFVKQHKGDNFTLEAQEAEALTESDTAEDQCGSPATPSPLRPCLDMAAIKAALACGLYPNEALLLGTLRASDANFSQLQRQRETIHTKDLSLIRQSEEIQQKDQLLVRKVEEMERTHEEYHTELSREQAQRRCEMQALTARLQAQAQVIQRQGQRHAQVVQDKDHQLQDKDHQLGHQGEELDRKQRELNSLAVEMRRQAEENRRQVEENRRQAEENRRQAEELERLRQLLQANNIQNNGPVNNAAAAAAVPAPAVPADPAYARCKVCLEEEAQCLFRPCRHVCCGTQCAPHFIGKTCPICRNSVRDWEVIYVA
ncbi:baculoviral IAP repeat-containing protein 3-like isoform X2 [Haliotis cracherodii]|uniref:baculoviral IAP repeat-containing protein 3-like isoform X2 n=1 Tax=Haliotis cracherodii TaxID=6455 RepID=UPI0039E8AECE